MTADGKMPERYPDLRRGEDGQLRAGGGHIRVEVTTRRVGGGTLCLPVKTEADLQRRQEQHQRNIDRLNDHSPKEIRIVQESDGPIEPDHDLHQSIDLDGDNQVTDPRDALEEYRARHATPPADRASQLDSAIEQWRAKLDYLDDIDDEAEEHSLAFELIEIGQTIVTAITGPDREQVLHHWLRRATEAGDDA